MLRFSSHFLWIVVLAAEFSIAWPAFAADRVIVFGDSWGVGTFLGLEKAFAREAPGQGVVPAAIAGELARVMNSDDPAHGLPYISATIAAHPTADLVHFSIGGNDLLFNWNLAKQLGTEELLLESIAGYVESIVMHTLAQRPDIEVFYSSYDYFRPLPNYLITPLEINTAFESLHSRVEERVADNPRVTTYNAYGLMQTIFGYSPLGIPPGDPSLPDINLPGPPEAFFDEIHLTWDMGDGSPGPFTYDLFADAQFEYFYRSRVIPEPTSWLLLAVIAAAALVPRKRRS